MSTDLRSTIVALHRAGVSHLVFQTSYMSGRERIVTVCVLDIASRAVMCETMVAPGKKQLAIALERLRDDARCLLGRGHGVAVARTIDQPERWEHATLTAGKPRRNPSVFAVGARVSDAHRPALGTGRVMEINEDFSYVKFDGDSGWKVVKHASLRAAKAPHHAPKGARS